MVLILTVSFLSTKETEDIKLVGTIKGEKLKIRFKILDFIR